MWFESCCTLAGPNYHSFPETYMIFQHCKLLNIIKKSTIEEHALILSINEYHVYSIRKQNCISQHVQLSMSTKEEDVEMRVLLYSFLAAEGSLKSQEVIRMAMHIYVRFKRK